MALRKQITLDSGVVGEYLRICSTSYKADGKICTINLGFYKDQTARLAGKLAIDHKSYEALDLEDISISALYTYLKTLDAYSGAEDI